VPHPISTR
jgi:hypothetical protein